ncbi:hypothetical protein K7X08_011260 [Anisodus acutangulus]|uniref:Mediator of RNA polymerase II transcription subunit 25 n=1 Tax=Anisodus acutangulus TaxID=402998 RepID=A0A9Q1M168_9SOLA|nr:hypothetical protein K7X08_011260 [Anisodus acutangulus]
MTNGYATGLGFFKIVVCFCLSIKPVARTLLLLEHRAFTEADSTEQNPSAGDAELSLVVFNVQGPYSDCMLQRSGWTRDIDILFQWLSAIHFSGGGFDDAAVTQGLAAALMMYSSLNGNETEENADGRRHCLLVTATHTSSCLADAETIAKEFPKCSVSLSLICPRKLPKLRAIYNVELVR